MNSDKENKYETLLKTVLFSRVKRRNTLETKLFRCFCKGLNITKDGVIDLRLFLATYFLNKKSSKNKTFVL